MSIQHAPGFSNIRRHAACSHVPVTHLLYAIRGLRKNPAFTAVALASLALGIGANTAIFSVMDAVHLRTIGARDPSQLVLVGDGAWSGYSRGIPNGAARLFSEDFAASLAKRATTLSGVASISSDRIDAHVRFGTGQADFETATLRVVSGSFFDVMGVGAALGRVIGPSDDLTPGGHPVAVMSYAMWDRRFNFDRGILGRTMALNGTAYTIVGVAAPGFRGIHTEESTDLWIPLSMISQVQTWFVQQKAHDPFSQFLLVLGRRKPGVSMTQADTETNALFQQWLQQAASTRPAADRPAGMAKAHIKLTPLSAGVSDFRRNFTDPLWILSAVAGMVLLIACANLANLLLARGNGRRREIAVRLALGAGRRRLIRELLIESTALALLGGVLGVMVAWWGSQYLLSLVSDPSSPLAIDTNPNWHVLAFTLLVSLVTGGLFGIAPALRSTRVDPGPALKEGKGSLAPSSRSFLSKALVAVQVTLALLLTTGAGLLIRTLVNLETANPGFQKQHVYVMQLDPESSSMKDQAFADLCRRIEMRARQTPGVVSASFSSGHFGGGRWVIDLRPEGTTPGGAGVNSDGLHVSEDYFSTLGMQLAGGRMFGPQDSTKSEPVAMVNQTLARKLFPGGDAIGRRFYEGRAKQNYYRIIGIVRDSYFSDLRDKEQRMFYVNARQSGTYSDLFVRVAGDPTVVISQLRGVIRSEDPNFAIARIDALAELVDRTLTSERLMARLAGFFASIALLLSAIGLYGILAYGVSQRTNEIGIRMALGAQPKAVLKMILKESFLLVGVGICVGVPAALAGGKLIESQLFGVAQRDPVTILVACTVMLMVALIASVLPALRASRLDPLVALRNE